MGKPDFLSTASGGDGGGNRVFEPAPPQKTGGDTTVDPQSIPNGGKFPKADPGNANNGDVGVGSPNGGRKPYTLKG